MIGIYDPATDKYYSDESVFTFVQTYSDYDGNRIIENNFIDCGT